MIYTCRNLLTYCCFRSVIGDVFGTSAFFDGTEPLIKSLFMSTACPDSPTKNTGFRAKQQSSKCAEHKHDDFFGSKLSPFLL